MKLNITGKSVTVQDVDPNTPLLWYLRDELNYTGTKFGCGKALCGACTVHVDGQPTRSCSFTLSDAVDKEVVTIEGLASEDKIANAVKKAWVDNHVPQCGYCQSGQVMTSISLLREVKKPTDAQIDDAMGGHICRCGTYQRIRNAIHQASREIV